jgi:glycosyltransferase involved in cell wall biosynthesis
MKILIIGPFPNPINGCSIANKILLQQLRLKKDLSVEFINTNTINISSEKVGQFSIKKAFYFLKFYKNIFRIFQSDLVYTTPGQTFFGLLKYIPFFFCSLLFNKPYIIHIHGNHLGNEFTSLSGLKKYLFAYFIKKADAGIVLSKTLTKNFDNLLVQKKIYIVENFATVDLTLNDKIIKSKDRLRILYLSNLMEEKGVLDFLDSLILLKNEGVVFSADIAGKIEDESELIVKSKFDELIGFINYHGVVFGEKKISLLQNSNVFILPTYYRMEGQPISLIEAMATGNIIVTTAFSGIPDIISEENGFFVESKNPQNIFKILVAINQNLDQYVDAFSNKNIEYVKSNFTEAQFAAKISNIFNHVYKQM